MKLFASILVMCLGLVNTGFPQSLAALRPQMDRHMFYTSGNSTTYSNTSYTRIPFELVNGMLVVQASIEGKPGSFILDTGAPTLILNGKGDMGKSEEMVTISSEESLARIVRVGSFSWGGIEKRDIEGMVMDISHVEENFKRELAGVIGFRIFEDREILIDTRNKLIYLSGDKPEAFMSLGVPEYTLPFQVQGHIPVLDVRIGNSTYTFGFDSGCSANLMDNGVLEQQGPGAYEEISTRMLNGFSPEASKASLIRVNEVQVAVLPAGPMQFLATDLSHLDETELEIQGLLGFPFVENKVFSISYERNEITFWNLGAGDLSLTP